jgi:sodium/bile acid cotransporter 7
MIAVLRKRWFLMALICGVGLACWRPQWLQPYTQKLPAQGLVFASLFLMAWTLDSRAMFAALMRPWPALWATVISYGLVPPLGWLAGRLLSQPDFYVGLMIISSVPCTLASAVVWTRRAGGNDATALLVILLTTATSWLATTGWLAIATGTEVGLRSGDMMAELVLILIMPVGLGQLCQIIRPLAVLAARHKMALGVIAQLLILAVILKAATILGERLHESPPVETGTVFLAAVFSVTVHLIALAGGFWTGRAWGFDRPSRIAVAFASSQKTLPVALVLFETYFKSYPLAVIPLVFYHAGQLIVDTFIADKLADRGRQETLPVQQGVSV